MKNNNKIRVVLIGICVLVAGWGVWSSCKKEASTIPITNTESTVIKKSKVVKLYDREMTPTEISLFEAKVSDYSIKANERKVPVKKSGIVNTPNGFFSVDGQVNFPLPNPDTNFYESPFATLGFSVNVTTTNDTSFIITFEGKSTGGVYGIHGRLVSFSSGTDVKGMNWTYILHATSDVCSNCDLDLSGNNNPCIAIMELNAVADTSLFNILPY